tara:strand:+ start:1447 stop:3135 length:1689 start_codon:yes stop_codon:yes gene_type:complete
MPKNSHNKKPKARNSVLLGFAALRRKDDGSIHYQFQWRRICIALSVLVIAGWLSLASAIYGYFKYVKEFEEISFWKTLVLPFRMEAHRKEMGDYQIRKSKEFIEEGDIRSAFYYLRAGIIRSPGNLEGRVLLAEFYSDILLMPEKALKTLQDGMPYAEKDNLEYIQTYIQALLDERMNKDVIELCQQGLKENPENLSMKLFLALSSATAYYYENNFEEAEALINKYELTRLLEGTILQANIEWSQKNPEAAIELLENALNRYPSNDIIYDYLAQFYQRLGKGAKARRYAILRTLENPLEADPRIDLLLIYNQLGQKKEEKREIEAILNQFNEQPQELHQVALFASQTQNVPLAQRIYTQALDNGFNMGPFCFALINTHIEAQEYPEALALLEEFDNEGASWMRANQGITNGLRALAHLGSGNPDIAQAYLKKMLEDRTLSTERLIFISNELQEMNGDDQAYQILIGAQKRDPENPLPLIELVSLELNTNNKYDTLKPHLEKLMTLNAPPSDLLRRAYTLLGSDRYIYNPDHQALLKQIESTLEKEKRREQEAQQQPESDVAA